MDGQLLDAFGRPLIALPVRKPAGQILLDGQVVADTLQCVHCNRHWIPQLGSGKVRGFCTLCSGPVCSAACAACIPFERKLDLAEKLGHR